MTGEVNFSGKIAKKIELKDINVENLDTAKKAKLDAIFDTEKSGDSKDALKIDELIKAVASIDSDKDGKLSDDELTKAWDALPDAKKQGLQKTEYIAYVRAMAAKNAELAKDDNIGNSYTIQLGEDLDDLVTRVLKSQGINEPTEAQKSKCKQAIVHNNSGSMKIENGQVKWLYAGSKIYLPTDTTSSKAKKTVKDQNNRDTVIERYNKWKNGEIKSFRYSVDDKGNQYEVRTGQADKKYGTVDGGVVSSYSSSSSSGRTVADVDLAKAFDLQKLKGGKVGENEYTDEQVRDRAQLLLSIFTRLEEEDNILHATKYARENNQEFLIQFKDDSLITGMYDENGNIIEIMLSNSHENAATMKINTDKMYLKMSDSSMDWDFASKPAIKDFGAIEKLLKSHYAIREQMGLPKQDFVDFSMITDNDLGDNDRDTVEGKIKSANEIIAGLEINSNIESAKTEKKDDHTEKIITMKDGTVVTAFFDDKNNMYRVSVKRGGDDNLDVTYDLAEDGDDKITVNLGNGQEPVESYGAIKDVEAIKLFVDNVGDSSGKTSARTGKIGERMSQEKAREIAKRYYDIAVEDKKDSTAQRILNRVKTQNEIDINNVVEVWEASKKGVFQNEDSSLLGTITDEHISEGPGGGRDMAVQTAKHIMQQLVDRAEEVGVDKKYIDSLKYWLEYDYTGWINDNENLPVDVHGQKKDKDLAKLLDPQIDSIISKIKEREALTPEQRRKGNEFTQDAAIEYGQAMLSSVKEFVGSGVLQYIHYNLMHSVDKDNAVKIWKAFKKGNGVQNVNSDLVQMLDSQVGYNSIIYVDNGFGFSSANPYTYSSENRGRDYKVVISQHVMQMLIDRARELEVDEYVINDGLERLNYDYTGWIQGKSDLPGGSLSKWFSPTIEKLVEAIEKKEAGGKASK